MKQPEGKFFGTVRVGEKGQIVISKPIRDMFNIKPGDTLLLLAEAEQGIAIIHGDRVRQVTEQILSNTNKSEAQK